MASAQGPRRGLPDFPIPKRQDNKRNRDEGTSQSPLTRASKIQKDNVFDFLQSFYEEVSDDEDSPTQVKRQKTAEPAVTDDTDVDEVQPVAPKLTVAERVAEMVRKVKEKKQQRREAAAAAATAAAATADDTTAQARHVVQNGGKGGTPKRSIPAGTDGNVTQPATQAAVQADPQPAPVKAAPPKQAPLIPDEQVAGPSGLAAPVDEDDLEEGEVTEVDRLIASLYRDNKADEAEGPAVTNELAEAIDVMCWRQYGEGEVAKLLKTVVPPANIPHLHPASVNSCLVDNSPAYGRWLQSSILKIHRLTQSSMIPVILLLNQAKAGKKVSNKQLADSLCTSVQLAGAAVTREMMLLRDVVRDGLPTELKPLVSRKQPVTDKAFGDSVEDEYARLVADKKDKAYFSAASRGQQYSSKKPNNAQPEDFLVSGGRNPSAPNQTQGLHSQSTIQMLTNTLSNFFKDQQKEQSTQKTKKSWTSKGNNKSDEGGKKKDGQGQQGRNRYYRD